MPMITERDAADTLAARLKRARVPFAREVPIGGVQVDFAFWAPKSELIVAELKAWEPSRENLDRALRQVELYKRRTGATAAYVVVPGIERGQPERGLVSDEELVRLLSEKYQGSTAEQGANRGGLTVAPQAGQWVLSSSGTTRRVSVHATQAEAIEAARLIARSAQADVVVHGRQGRIVSRDSYGHDAIPRAPRRAARKRPAGVSKKSAKRAALKKASPRARRRPAPKHSPRRIFAAMPFAQEYDDAYMAMASAADKASAVCERVDHQAYSGDVVKQIKQMIRKSAAVIVDLSDSRANVLYEAGFAEALGIPTIHICSTPLESLPFDVRNDKTIRYGKGQTHKLAKVLVRELRAILT